MQGGTQRIENTLLTEWKETVFTDSTNPKWEVAENNIGISEAITQLQNFLIKVEAQVSQQQQEITESGEINCVAERPRTLEMQR